MYKFVYEKGALRDMGHILIQKVFFNFVDSWMNISQSIVFSTEQSRMLSYVETNASFQKSPIFLKNSLKNLHVPEVVMFLCFYIFYFQSQFEQAYKKIEEKDRIYLI